MVRLLLEVGPRTGDRSPEHATGLLASLSCQAHSLYVQWIGARSMTGIPWAESRMLRSWCSAPRSLRCTAPLRVWRRSLVVPVFPCCPGLSSNLFLGTYCCYLRRGVISWLASGGSSSWTVMSSLSPPDLQQEEVWWGMPGSVAERQNSAGADLHTDINDLLDGATAGLHTCPAAAEFNFTLKPAYSSTS